MPKVSVIIPVYNKETYLADTMRSVLNQEFQDLEVIAVNDGSKDRSLEILHGIASKDSRLRIIDIPNGGVSHARNVGMEHAEGEYLTFVDGDDTVQPGYLANLYDCIVSSNADLVISGFQKFWEDGRSESPFVLPFAKGTYPLEELLQNFAQTQFRTGVYGCCTSKIFRSSLADGVRFDESLRLAEDFDFYLKLLNRVRTVMVDDQAGYNYRQEAVNSSSIRSDYDCDYLSQLKIYLRFRDFLRNHGAYQNENQQLVEEKLQDYLYFSVFYCSKERMREDFPALKELMQNEGISCVSADRRKSLLLGLLGKNRFGSLRSTLLLYRAVHNMIHGGK